MKRIFILAAAGVPMLLSGEPAGEIRPAKPVFEWKKDAENVPQERDPLTPVDFVWPRPVKNTNTVIQAGPAKAKLELTVEFIGFGEKPENRFAKVKGFTQFLEQGKEYSFTAKGYKVAFKIVRVDPDKIVVSYEGEMLEFGPKAVNPDVNSKPF